MQAEVEESLEIGREGTAMLVGRSSEARNSRLDSSETSVL